MSEFQRKEVGTHGEDVPINRVSSLDSPTNDLRELDTGSKENLMDIQGVRIQEYFPKEDRVMHNKTEEQDRSTNKQRRIYSSTSSVYAEHTISDPNNDQVLYCIAAVLQAQMFDDFYNDEFSSLAYPQFTIPVALAVEYGGERETIPEEILRHETLNDNELRDLLLQKALPTVDTIYRFFKYLMVLTDYSIECNILALVYINRITVKNNIAVNMENWRGLWLGAIILAQKVWDDNPLKTSSFSSVLTSVSKEALIAAEMKVFSLLEYSTTVRPSVYVKYFLELHELFREITGGDSNGFRWHLHPMTLAEKKRLELRSKRHGREYRKNHKISSSSSFTTTSSASISIVSSKAVTPLNIRTEQPTVAVTTANTATAAVNALSIGTSKSSPSTSNFTTKTLKNSDAEHPRSITLEDATYASVSRYVIN